VSTDEMYFYGSATDWGRAKVLLDLTPDCEEGFSPSRAGATQTPTKSLISTSMRSNKISTSMRSNDGPSMTAKGQYSPIRLRPS